MDIYKQPTFKDIRGSYTPLKTDELNMKWDQCSISVNNKKFTFRGLHYQTNPPQTKYVKVVQGSIVDFMVDLDTMEVDYAMINSESAVLIPNNKAHGFLTLSDDTIVVYMVEGDYNPESEHSIIWSSIPEVKRVIDSYVGDSKIIISDKDRLGK